MMVTTQLGTEKKRKYYLCIVKGKHVSDDKTFITEMILG
jgi:hypothetical protein